MTIDAISPITSLGNEFALAAPNRLAFADFLKSEINAAEHKLSIAEEQVRALAVGETENLHQVMLAVTKAKTAFDLVVEIRNRLLEGYQEISRMQV